MANDVPAWAEKKDSSPNGERYGALLVMKFDSSTRRGHKYQCLCDCGSTATRYIAELKKGSVFSCGCISLHLIARLNKTHGKSKTAEYAVWRSMIARCENPRDKRFHRYGGRGISVCSRWRTSFPAFIEDVGERPAPGLSLDRINNDRNYEPSNVRWASRKEQMRNASINRLVTYRALTLPLVEVCELVGANYKTVLSRLKRGWSDAEAINGTRNG